jgi:predicted TIM-barrel fold metal-dependent hydrolase
MLPPGMAGFAERFQRASAAGDEASIDELIEGFLDCGPVGYDGAERLRWVDEHHIKTQILLPSHGMYPYVFAKRSGLTELAFAALGAYNTWAAGQLSGHTDRLIPVCLVDLADLEWALAEIRRMRELGSRVVQVKGEPADGKSLAHPDFEPFWAEVENLGMTVMIHILGGIPAIHPGWADTGGRQQDYFLLYIHHCHQIATWTLGSLILSGTLERHPRLNFICSELGVHWVPGFCDGLDDLVRTGFGRHEPGAADDFNWGHLSLLPSEYVQRQVRVSALSGCDTLRPAFDRSPDGVIVFSSDFPHPEGSADAIDIFDQRLGDVDPESRRMFFGGSLATALQA